MTREPTSFSIDAPLVDVVDCLMANDFCRVLIHDQHELVGLVSRADLMPPILEALRARTSARDRPAATRMQSDRSTASAQPRCALRPRRRSADQDAMPPTRPGTTPSRTPRHPVVRRRAPVRRPANGGPAR